MLKGKELPAAAISALYGIVNHHGPGSITGFPYSLQEIFTRHLYTAYALDPFYNYGTGILIHGGLNGLCIIKRYKLHMAGKIQRGFDGRVVCYGYGC
ncbi:hypothetical protein FQZ97_1037660 [compost metagenome]